MCELPKTLPTTARRTEITQARSTEITQARSTEITQARSTEITPGQSIEITPGRSKEITQARSKEITQARNTEITPVWSTEITQVRSKEITTIRSTEITQVRSTEITPAQSTWLTPTRSTDITPAQRTEITPARSTEITPPQSTEIYPPWSTELNPPQSTAINPPQRTEISSLSHTEDINVKSNTDKNTCSITGCELLTTDKLILADSKNRAVKIMDLQRKVVVEEKTIEATPYDIAVIPNNQVAVTIQCERKILIMTTASTLSISKTFSVNANCSDIVFHENKLYIMCHYPVNANCSDIVFHENKLYIMCHYPRQILVLDIQGKVNNTISLEDDKRFSYARYISKSSVDKSIYVSTWGTSPVLSLTSEGGIIDVYKGFTEHVHEPLGMIVVDDGSVLVCCFGTSEIYRLSKDLAHGQMIKEGLNGARSICYSSERHEVYVGSNVNDYVQVFRLL